MEFVLMLVGLTVLHVKVLLDAIALPTSIGEVCPDIENPEKDGD
jgi:hypothetical protein